MAKYLDETGLIYLWSKIKTLVSNSASISNGTITIGQNTITPVVDANYVHTDNNYTSNEKTKLSGIAAGAEVNQSAFSNVKVGSSTIEADSKTDTLEIAAGGDITISADTTNDKVTISVTTPKNTSDLVNDSGFITTSDIPEGAAASTTVPLMDGTATIGTELAFARGDHRHPTDTTRVAANAAITGATKTKITYDSKGLVTAGADLSASDIPSITLSKISDVTATAAELNILDGVTASTAELNYVDGVTSAIQTQLNAKAPLASPALTGTPSAPTATKGTNTTQIATTAFVSTALGDYILTSAKGAASGVCPLNASSKIDATYLPSYVDDVVEAYIRSGQTALSSTWLATGSASGTVITPESGVIYVIMNGTDTYPTNSQYRWATDTYVKLNDGGMTAITTAEIDTIVAA